MPRPCWQKKRAQGLLRPVCGHAARQSGRVLRAHCTPGAIPSWAGACRRRASRPAHAIACWRRGPGAFWQPVRLARAAPIKFACTFPMRAARCWAIGCTAAIPPRWGGPPCTAGAAIYNACRRAHGPRGRAGICAAAAGYGRPGRAAGARRRAARQLGAPQAFARVRHGLR